MGLTNISWINGNLFFRLIKKPSECEKLFMFCGDRLEEKWRFQAEMLRAECNFLRTDREFALKKLEKNRLQMEKTLRLAVQTLISVSINSIFVVSCFNYHLCFLCWLSHYFVITVVPLYVVCCYLFHIILLLLLLSFLYLENALC